MPVQPCRSSVNPAASNASTRSSPATRSLDMAMTTLVSTSMRTSAVARPTMVSTRHEVQIEAFIAAFVALVIGGVLVLTQVGHGDETDANDPCAAVHSIADL